MRARGSSSRIQAATKMGCIEGREKWRGAGWLDVESMLFWWSGLRLTQRGNRRLVVAHTKLRLADPPSVRRKTSASTITASYNHMRTKSLASRIVLEAMEMFWGQMAPGNKRDDTDLGTQRPASVFGLVLSCNRSPPGPPCL